MAGMPRNVYDHGSTKTAISSFNNHAVEVLEASVFAHQLAEKIELGLITELEVMSIDVCLGSTLHDSLDT